LYGEELGGVGRPVPIEQGFLAVLYILLQSCVFFPKDPRPSEVHGAMREDRRAVGLAVLGVELMSELVEDDVVAVVDVRRTGSNIVPRQDDGSLFPGLPETGLHPFGDDSRGVLLAMTSKIRVRVDDDRVETWIAIGLAVQEEDARLRSDGGTYACGSSFAVAP